MNKPLVFILVLILLGCGKPRTSMSDNQATADCEPFYRFDRLEHFQIDINQDSISYLQFADNRQAPLTTLQLRLSYLLLSDGLKALSDTIRVSEAERLGYTKKQVDESKFEAINAVLCEGLIPEEIKVNLCLPVFRDILVFRHKNRVIGFAKLCFECDQFIFVGTDKKTRQFGQTGEFRKLATILQIDYRP